MSPLLQRVLQEIKQLTTEEQLEVIIYIAERLKGQMTTQNKTNNDNNE